jgi:hypothetical protein
MLWKGRISGELKIPHSAVVALVIMDVTLLRNARWSEKVKTGSRQLLALAISLKELSIWVLDGKIVCSRPSRLQLVITYKLGPLSWLLSHIPSQEDGV